MPVVGQNQIGRVLGGRYRLVAPVGSGASAVVFVADDVELRRRVAVKVLHPSLAEDSLFLKRFRAEAQAAAALNHPNIMAVHDWGEDRGAPYLVLEFLSGGSLRSILDRNRLLSPSQALLVGLDAARGLDYAHRRGFVHRDIKPANLLFDDDGRLRIADFGLARALAEAAWTEPAGVVLGTARYASPEQARGLPVDGRSDVYSLALVLIESVTGQVPFAADTTVATLMNRLDKLMPASADLGPLASVVERAGRPDPAERYSAADLGRALIHTAERLPRPAPLPLVRTTVIGDADDTLLPPVAPSRTAELPLAGLATEPTPSVAPPAAGNGAGDDVAAHTPASNGSPPAPASPKTPVLYDEMAQPRRRGRLIAGLIAAMVAVAAIAVAVVVYQRNSVPSYPVPPLVGVEIARARNIVSQYEWRVDERHGRNDTYAKDMVYEQAPRSGQLKRGASIVLSVSDGPFPAKLPDLAGRAQAAAQKALAGAGLKVGTVKQQYDEKARAGNVLSWTVGGKAFRPGTEVPKGTAVDMVVSQGAKPRTVPAVVNVPFAQAVTALQQLGLVVKRVPDVFSDTAPVGAVAAIAPAAGTQVQKGSTVNVAVSKGPDVVAVPNVIGMKLQEAVAAIAQAGLAQGTITGSISSHVRATDPGPTLTVKRGTPVNITMG